MEDIRKAIAKDAFENDFRLPIFVDYQESIEDWEYTLAWGQIYWDSSVVGANVEEEL